MKKAGYRGIEGTVNAEDVKGSKVLTNQGKEIEKVVELRIDQDNFSLAGILVRRGIITEDLFVGSEYIKGISTEGIVLKMTPYTELVGMKVFDAHGKEIGKVKEVNRIGTTNNMVSLVVRQGFGKEDITIPKTSIDTVGENIILTDPSETITAES